MGYYLDLLRMRNWSRVELISEDTRNPCLLPLVKQGAIYHQRTLMHDLALMMRARNLAIGRGTLGIAVALMSPYLKNLFTFNQSSPRIGVHRNCEPTDRFFIKVLRRWRNREQDRAMIQTEGCKRWTLVTKKDPDMVMHDGVG
jgi:hypothetical protein